MKKGPEQCMFCGCAPCECNGPPKVKRKAQPKRKEQVSGGEEEVQGQFQAPEPKRPGRRSRQRMGRPRDREAGGTTPVNGESRGGSDSARQRNRRLQRDVAKHRAIIALADAGLLAPGDVKKYAETIRPTTTGVLLKAEAEVDGNQDQEGG